MTQEEKELLLKDLCARLPYGVMCHIEIPHSFIGFVEKGDLILISITSDTLKCDFKSCWGIELKFIKLYLRPMSSMTEEELHEYNMHLLGITTGVDAMNFMFWIYQRHLDILHFIEKNLAIEAPEGMYNIKEK